MYVSFFSHRCAYVKEDKVESSRSIPRLRSAWKCNRNVENNRFRAVSSSWTRARVRVCFEMTTTTTSSWGVPETSPAYTTGYRKFLWLYHIVKVITPIYLTIRTISSSDAHTPPRSCGAHTSPLAPLLFRPRGNDDDSRLLHRIHWLLLLLLLHRVHRILHLWLLHDDHLSRAEAAALAQKRKQGDDAGDAGDASDDDTGDDTRV